MAEEDEEDDMGDYTNWQIYGKAPSPRDGCELSTDNLEISACTRKENTGPML